MPRWLRVLRGMLGTGASFAVALSALFAVVAVGRWIFLGVDLDLRHLWIETILTGTAPGGFLLGVVFAGGLAITNRESSLHDLSAPRFTALGAGAGLLLSLLVGGGSADLLQVLANGVFFSALGAGAAAGTLLIAKRGATPLAGGEEPGKVGDGSAERPADGSGR